MARVDASLGRWTGGLTNRDLADYAYRDAFESGDRPVDVARAVLEEEGYPF